VEGDVVALHSFYSNTAQDLRNQRKSRATFGCGPRSGCAVEKPKMTTLFQTTIEHLLKSHKLLENFQKQDSFHVRFEKTGYQPLVIERHGDMISVAHYFEQNGDLIADPDVELHYPSWVPTAITQAFFGYRQKFIERDGKTYFDTRFDREVSSFLSMWARNIKAQGWAEGGRVHHDEQS
jgi:hypothetical protein